MATRYYPSRQSSNVFLHGPCAGTWQQGDFRPWVPAQDQFLLSRSKATTGTQGTITCRTNQQNNYDYYFTRWITPALADQDLSGTFDLCFGVQAQWNDLSGFFSTSTVYYKLHVYLANGQTYDVRTVLINNYVDSVAFPGTSGFVFRSLAAAQTLAAAHANAGDVIVVELGFRIASSPTPVVTYPPTATTVISFRSLGANPALADAVAGETGVSRASWFQFSMNLVEQAMPAAPANDACADAIVIPPTLPYQSGFLDSTGSTDTNNALWWTWTAPSDQFVVFHTLGTNHAVVVTVYDNTFGASCGALGVPISTLSNPASFRTGRSHAFAAFDAVAGTQYWIKVNWSGTSTPAAGGAVRLGAFVRSAPVADDLYLPAGSLGVFRDGQLTNITNDFFSLGLTGVAFDYTERPMISLVDGLPTTAVRVLVGLHDYLLVEIIDAATLNLSTAEIDFIGDAWTLPAAHPAQLYCTAAGQLYVGWFGNGYLYVAASGTSLVAILNTVSNDSVYTTVRQVDAIAGDSQSGAPFADTVYAPTVEVAAPWAIAVDEGAQILYYTSGGFYVPGTGAAEIRRFDLATQTQLPAFATLPLVATHNPGLRGLQLLPDGGLLVCNGPVVQRLDAAGAVIQTYTPSIAVDSTTLVDVRVTVDVLHFWTIDLESTRLYRFNLATGVEEADYQTWGVPGSLVQMGIYQPDGITPPPIPIPTGCTDDWSEPGLNGLPYVPLLPDPERDDDEIVFD